MSKRNGNRHQGVSGSHDQAEMARSQAARSVAAMDRDRAAETRDQSAEARDDTAEARDATALERHAPAERVVPSGARDRDRGAEDRVSAAADRVAAARDRLAASLDVRVYLDAIAEHVEQLRIDRLRLIEAQKIASIGNFEWDVALGTRHWSSELFRIHGLLPDQGVPSTEDILSWIHPNDREVVAREFGAALESGHSFDFDQRVEVPRGGGEFRFLHTRGESATDGDGRVISVRGTVQDVTDSKYLERELERQEQQFRSLLSSASEGLWGVDGQGRCTFVSRAAAELLGWTPEEMIGRDPHDLVHHSHSDGSPSRVEDCPLCQVVTTGASCRLEDEVLWRKDGTALSASCASFPIMRDGVVMGAVLAFTDMTEYKASSAALREANDLLRELATTDPLTRLANRIQFAARLTQALDVGRRNAESVAVLFIDLDRLKEVNDRLGHRCGDELLVEVGRRLEAAMRRSDTVARLGGDEFAVLLAGPTSPEHAASAAERVVAAMRPDVVVSHGVELSVRASVGVALWPDDPWPDAGDCNEELLRRADVAMYRAKKAGGDRFEMFQPAMNVAAQERRVLEIDLRHALEAGDFFLRYQPQIDLASGEVVAVEALLRWAHPSRGELLPATFLALAEDTRLIVPLGAWVLEEACRQAARWRTVFSDRPPLRMAVNVSAGQLASPGFSAVVADALAASGTPAGEFELEITEGMLDDEAVVATLHTLHGLGVSLAIDDYGMGTSSLASLLRCGVDRLKLDSAFIAGLGNADGLTGVGGGELVAATIHLAHALRLDAVAEGVETDEQRLTLRGLGCEQGQGFLWTTPLRASELPDWLRTVRQP